MITSTVRNGRVFLSSDKQELHCVTCGRWCRLLIDGECCTCAAGISVPQERLDQASRASTREE